MGRGRLAYADLFRGCTGLSTVADKGVGGTKLRKTFADALNGWSLGILCLFYSNNLWRTTVAWNLVDLVFQLAFYSYLQCHWLKCETLVLPLTQGNCKKGIEFLTGVCSVYQARAQSCSNTKFPYIQRTVAVYICSCIVHVSRKQKNQTVCST